MVLVEDTGMWIGTEPAETRTISGPLFDDVIGDYAEGLKEFKANVKVAVFDGAGEFDCERYGVLSVFADTLDNAKAKVSAYIKSIDSRAETEGLDCGIEEVATHVWEKTKENT